MGENIYYNLFLRNWKNNRATVERIDQAVAKELISPEEADTIKATERNSL